MLRSQELEKTGSNKLPKNNHPPIAAAPDVQEWCDDADVWDTRYAMDLCMLSMHVHNYTIGINFLLNNRFKAVMQIAAGHQNQFNIGMYYNYAR